MMAAMLVHHHDRQPEAPAGHPEILGRLLVAGGHETDGHHDHQVEPEDNETDRGLRHQDGRQLFTVFNFSRLTPGCCELFDC